MKFFVFVSLFFVSTSLQARSKIKIDGSSTVYPITEAVAEEFSLQTKSAYVLVGVSGTGGGFKKFLNNEIDINNASREIKASEIKKAKQNNLKYLEIPIANDGITIIVNPNNTWAHDITAEELKKIWEPGSKVNSWQEIRSSWPDKPLRLYGPGVDSGTFDYFTKAINGKAHISRNDFTKSEDDNVLVRAVSGDKYALAFIGFAYYYENKNKLKALKVYNGKKMVKPSFHNIRSGEYKPLARQVYIYVTKSSAKKQHIQDFIRYYLKHASALSKEVGYVPLSNDEYTKFNKKFTNFTKL